MILLDLLGIVGCYAAAALLARWLAGRAARAGAGQQVVLVAGNQGMRIEWYVRALLRQAKRSGTPVGVTVLLERSEDDTGAIVERLARREESVRLARGDERERLAAGGRRDGADGRGVRGPDSGGRLWGGSVLWLELNRAEDVAKLPL